jgi:DNA-binding NarL/FixJ family response regulator
MEPHDYLTDREWDVFELLIQGKTPEEISATLVLALPTVDFHRQQVYKKLYAHNHRDVIRYGIEHGFVELNLVSEHVVRERRQPYIVRKKGGRHGH